MSYTPELICTQRELTWGMPSQKKKNPALSHSGVATLKSSHNTSAHHIPHHSHSAGPDTTLCSSPTTTMEFSFTTVAALFLLFPAASCAPPGLSLQDACANVQSSSLELNHIARAASVQVSFIFRSSMWFELLMQHKQRQCVFIQWTEHVLFQLGTKWIQRCDRFLHLTCLDGGQRHVWPWDTQTGVCCKQPKLKTHPRNSPLMSLYAYCISGTRNWWTYTTVSFQSCIVKMLDVLTSYSSAVENVAGFQSCSQFVSKVKPAIHKLHKEMRTCVKSRGKMHHKKVSLTWSPTRLSCLYSERSILVFQIFNPHM